MWGQILTRLVTAVGRMAVTVASGGQGRQRGYIVTTMLIPAMPSIMLPKMPPG